MKCNGDLSERALTLDNVNPNLQNIEYVSRGPLMARTRAIQQELDQGIEKPFSELTKASIGDCHAMGQVPMTFIRQVLALVTYPPLLADPQFPDDVKTRAREILSVCEGGSVGSYSDKKGIEFIRKRCAQYIERRDGGIESDYNNVILTAGSVGGIQSLAKLLNRDVDGKRPGIMGPLPQYPMYSATCAELNMHHIGYYLDEDNNWALDVKELQRSISEARKHCNPRAIVVINPGNPTGQVLTRRNVEEIIKFAQSERLLIMADEVYQDNVYTQGSEFHSFKKVLTEMGPPYSGVELASFMSTSKGYMGECGFRGGYVELTNFLPEIRALFVQLTTIVSCPPIVGQAVLDCVVKPPVQGELSYELFSRERSEKLASLAQRAKMVTEGLNAIDGITCSEVQGSMFAFPRLHLPAKAIAKAEEMGQTPDTFYVNEILEKTGICIFPGTNFGQRPGTHHFRTTTLLPHDQLKVMLDKLRTFHAQFLEEYKS